MVERHPDIIEWRERYARLKYNIDFEPLAGAPFHWSAVPVFHGLRIGTARFSPGFTFRDDELVKDGDDDISLTISLAKDLEVSHRGRELRLGRGDATMLHVCSTGRVGSRHDFGYIGVLIPVAELAARGARPLDFLMRPLPRRREPLRLLRGYLHLLEKHRAHTAAWSHEIVRGHVIDLAALVLDRQGSIGESGLNAVVAARLSSALDHIDSDFDNPALSLSTVARSQGISPRYLQRLLELSGVSFTERVNALRLEKAFALLSDPGSKLQKISEVAYAVGYSDLSHFNRSFRARYGDTPSGVRRSSKQM